MQKLPLTYTRLAVKSGKKVISGFQGHQRQQREGDRRNNRRDNRGARGDNNNAKVRHEPIDLR